jgi:hypothetical protein
LTSPRCGHAYDTTSLGNGTATTMVKEGRQDLKIDDMFTSNGKIRADGLMG